MNSLNDIHQSLLWTLNKRGYVQLTEVQAKVLKKEFINPDLLVSAETGSGKTLAYGINIMTSLLQKKQIELESSNVLSIPPTVSTIKSTPS